jgi:GT2 family glycosyltransferase/glycosyltransferase involved in cell wall biosynthesis
MVGAYIAGWALAEPDTGNCAITIVDPEGQVIAKGRASRHRADLACLGAGRTTLAFRIAVKNGPERRHLRVLANGEDITGSPIATGAGLYDGDATVERGAVVGWVTERVNGFEPPVVTVVNQHGIVVGEQATTLDTSELDPRFAPARFSIDLDDRCFGAGEQRLTILANGIKFAERSCNFRLEGNLEIITPEVCCGWLISPDWPPRTFRIDVFRDGVLAGSSRCDVAREDVRAVFPESVTPAFDIKLTKPVNGVAEASTISLRFHGADTDLFKGPYVIGNRPAAVVAAQRAARLAHRQLEGIGPAERAVIQMALSDFLANARKGDGFVATHQPALAPPASPRPRLNVIIPIYRGIEVTRACIESVLAHRNPATDPLILINDASPDAGMAGMLNGFAHLPNVFILTNETNRGFVQTVNRGLAFAVSGDVLLLNSDTVVYAGGLDELCRVAASAAEIATVTALSSNATIFSYPHANLRSEELADIDWPELAAVALRENAGLAIDAPTGHGFCLLIKGEVLRRVGHLDESFGRGYGEENDFCMRAANLGYRHVVAAGALVRHRESISFVGEKASLLAANLPRLNAMYPEYTPVIMDFEDQDGLRRGRWALDKVRLNNAVEAGQEFVLLITNKLTGGTAKAIEDIETAAGYGGAVKMTLRCLNNGYLELLCEAPAIWATFSPREIGPLFEVISAARPTHVLVHQLLGYPAAFIEHLGPWARELHGIYYTHDFYPLCPRVTMIDAIGRFCDVADSDTCGRCIEMDGAHATSKMTELSPAEHRRLFADLLQNFRHVVSPSPNTAGYFKRAFPDLAVKAIPHPENAGNAARAAREGSNDEIVLLGAIGPHKGSGKLLEIAQRARLTHPKLKFRVIGFTNIDKQLSAIGNVTITGHYEPEELPALLAQSRGRLAIFLPSWPETYSYTLSEVAGYGFIPLVPDIGAPAERVRAAQFGVVFPFPINAEQVLDIIADIGAGRLRPYAEGATPDRLYPSPSDIENSVKIMRARPKTARRPVPVGAG